MRKIINKDIIKNIDEIVWYIPFRRLRDSVRQLLISYMRNLDDICNELEIRRKENELTTYNEDYYYKKRIFKENVRWVEIGISSFCNRKCWFCPNSIIDRNSCNIELKEDLFLKLLSELREVNYSNNICLHRYNEPLYNKQLLIKRIKQVRKYLPQAYIYIVTNGDYLTLDYLKILRDAGVDEIRISYYYICLHRYNEPLYNKQLLIKRIKQVREYLPQAYIYIFTNGDYLTLDYLKILRDAGVDEIRISYYYNGNDRNVPFDIENIVKPGMQKFISKFNLNYNVLYQNDNFYSLEIEYEHMKVSCVSANFKTIGADRGGILKDNVNIINRICKCFTPNFQVVVDYDANYTLCCNIRSDDEYSKDYILGNIETHSIFDIFMGEKAINFRKELLLECPKKGPCAHCSDKRAWEGL